MNYRTTLRAIRAPAHPNIQFLCLHAAARGGFLPCQLTSVNQLHKHFRCRSYSTNPETKVAPTASSSGDKEVYSPVLNPPASTRPPPLTLPARDPQSSTFTHLFSVGKAYLKFYKTGLSAVLTNRSLLRSTLASKPPPDNKPPSVFSPSKVPASYTRADWLLLWRVRHDLLRVPLFGLVLLVCGEFTPLVVLAIDGVVPYTCRLPRQIAASMGKAEDRRRVSFNHLEYSFPQGILAPGAKSPEGAARTHVLRSLHLVSTFWDRAGFVPPGLWQLKGKLRMAFLEGDDRLLMRDGGLPGLEPEEVRIACAERGIDVLGRGDSELRQCLGDWLRLTADDEAVAKKKRMTVLLTTRVENWPANRNFALPDWHL